MYSLDNDNMELEELRNQYNALKAQVEKQEIINDRLLMKTFKTKVRGIHAVAWKTIFCGVFVILISPFAFHYNPAVNLSWAFVIATDVMMALCIGLTTVWHVAVKQPEAGANLLEFAKSIKLLKQRYRMWLRYCWLLIVPWLAWLCVEVYQNVPDKKFAIFFISALLLGGLVGALIGFMLHNKVISNCDEIIYELKAE